MNPLETLDKLKEEISDFKSYAPKVIFIEFIDWFLEEFKDAIEEGE